MSEWSVHVEARGSEPLGSDAADSIDTFVDQLTDYSGAAAGGPGFDTYSAQFSVDAPAPEDAVVRGVETFRKAAAAAGLPEWSIIEAQAIDADELDRQLTIPNFPELVGTREIADILEVSRQRAHQLTHRDDFPVPIADLATGPVWTRPSLNHFIDQWVREPGRPPKGRLTSPAPYDVGEVIDTADGPRRVISCRLLAHPGQSGAAWVLDTEAIDHR